MHCPVSTHAYTRHIVACFKVKRTALDRYTQWLTPEPIPPPFPRPIRHYWGVGGAHSYARPSDRPMILLETQSRIRRGPVRNVRLELPPPPLSLCFPPSLPSSFSLSLGHFFSLSVNVSLCLNNLYACLSFSFCRKFVLLFCSVSPSTFFF